MPCVGTRDFDRPCLSRNLAIVVSDWIRGSHASWKVLDFFSLKFPDLESPGKSLWSWKLKFTVLEKLLPSDVIF